jgi:hypothetical protein
MVVPDDMNAGGPKVLSPFHILKLVKVRPIPNPKA